MIKTTNYLLIVFLLMSLNIFGQKDDWTKEMSRDGKTEVMSFISSRVDENGNEVQLAEYSATTIADGNIDNFSALLKDASLHKIFMENADISEELKAFSDNEWLVYYYFDSPWPMPNSDCVMTMKFSKNKTDKTIVYEGKTTPKLLEEKDVKRMNYYIVNYTIKELEEGKVEVSMWAKVTPVVSGPDWMINSWFPKGPAGILSRLVKAANNL
jgi:hypothetical protein